MWLSPGTPEPEVISVFNRKFSSRSFLFSSSPCSRRAVSCSSRSFHTSISSRASTFWPRLSPKDRTASARCLFSTSRFMPSFRSFSISVTYSSTLSRRYTSSSSRSWASSWSDHFGLAPLLEVSAVSGLGSSSFSCFSSSFTLRFKALLSRCITASPVFSSTFSDIISLTPSSETLSSRSLRNMTLSLRSKFSFDKRSMVLLCSFRVRFLPFLPRVDTANPDRLLGDITPLLFRYSFANDSGTWTFLTCRAIMVSVGAVKDLEAARGVSGGERGHLILFALDSALPQSALPDCHRLAQSRLH